MSTNCCGAEKVFDLKSAKKELKKYLKSGPNKATRRLIESIGNQNPKGKTLLDIGGGIGAIQWHFLEQGAIKTTDVDYSNGYIQVARSHAQEKNLTDQVNYIEGDFLEVANQVHPHDFVTLDKVICCYPDYVGLLDLALAKSKEGIGLVYPMGGPIAKFIAFLGRIFLRLTGNSFRPYIHPVVEIRQLVSSGGFEVVSSKTSFPWHVEVYHRSSL